MGETETNQPHGGNFHLSKWFLDFVSDNGDAMIFYSANLTWHSWVASYTSWLRYNPFSGLTVKSRFRNVQIPQQKENLIIWKDVRFGVSGKWESLAEVIKARIVDTEEGFLDWICFQPASRVALKINNQVLAGSGYAEQLILTIPPWKIAMDELRWGRFGSEQDTMVWIELRAKSDLQWLWLNGAKMENCIIKDDHIDLPDKNLVLKLDRGVELESEKKIYSVVEKLVRYIPGISKVMPVRFLMADEVKWFSKGEIQIKCNTIARGVAIHERINFCGISHELKKRALP